WAERHIWTMGDEVQHPVADDEEADHQKRKTIASFVGREKAQKKPPPKKRDERVGVGIGDEIEGGERCIARFDPNGFDAEQEEDRPQEIGQLRSNEQHQK